MKPGPARQWVRRVMIVNALIICAVALWLVLLIQMWLLLRN